MKKIKYLLLILLIFILSIYSVYVISADIFFYNYPPMIFEKGVNISASKQAVYSIPDSYFTGLKYLKFVNYRKLIVGTGFVNGKTNLDVYIIGNNKYLQNENIVIYLGSEDNPEVIRKTLVHELYHYDCFRDNDIRYLEVCSDEEKAWENIIS